MTNNSNYNFKIGDKVKILNRKNMKGRIQSIIDDYYRTYFVRLDNGTFDFFMEIELEKIYDIKTKINFVKELIKN